jgi:hypothetical protein
MALYHPFERGKMFDCGKNNMFGRGEDSFGDILK